MASSREADRLTAEHRRRQAALASQVRRALLQVMPLLDYDRLDDTAPGFVAAVTRVVQAGYELSSDLASRYFQQFRVQEVGSRASPDVLADGAVPFNAEQVRTSAIVMGPVYGKQLTARGVTGQEFHRKITESVLSSGVRHVMNGGRLRLTHLAQADSRALGVARIASSGACAFCAMLASRGAVYKSDQDWSAGFDAHEHCDCGTEVVYSRDARLPGAGEDYRRLWDEVVGPVDAPGHIKAGPGSGRSGQLASGNNVPLQLFRQALEARRAQGV